MSPSNPDFGVKNIEFNSLDELCPKPLYDIFSLIKKCHKLDRDDFDFGRQIDERKRDANRIQKDLLCLQAANLVTRCRYEGYQDWSEHKWLEIQMPLVFRSLDTSYEETSGDITSHLYCSACHKQFDDESRPHLNSEKDSMARKLRRMTLQDIQAPPDLCKIHRNIPSLRLHSQLRYNRVRDSNAQTKIPDATIGLCTFDLKSSPWTLSKFRPLVEDDRVKYFDRSLLRTILAGDHELKPPYKWNSESTVPFFSFALYEAKKWTGKISKAQNQSVGKLVDLFYWQQNLFQCACLYESQSTGSEAAPFHPVVWSFASAGSRWALFALFSVENVLYSVRLWRGDVGDMDDALQLLSINEVIKLWAEHVYIPAVSASLQCIRARQNAEKHVALEDTLWREKLDLNDHNIAWLFSQPSSTPVDASLNAPESPKRTRSTPPEKTSSTPRPPLTPQPATTDNIPTNSSNSPAFIKHARGKSQEYTPNPFSEDIVWILDRYPGKGGLVLVEIPNGNRKKPIIIQDESNSASCKAWTLIREAANKEKARFFAILPLCSREYSISWQKAGQELFECLEDKLSLEKLLSIITNGEIPRDWSNLWPRPGKGKIEEALERIRRTVEITTACVNPGYDTCYGPGHPTFWAIEKSQNLRRAWQVTAIQDEGAMGRGRPLVKINGGQIEPEDAANDSLTTTSSGENSFEGEGDTLVCEEEQSRRGSWMFWK